uniref:Uncharacterized protein n=1 Tax=Vibrio anguillarum serovar O2 TaxID=105260 RepID=A4Q8I0_VIBAN|nr:hypothetical protein [Vibrio anguillarum]CAJ87703.1 hypothetical protein [Vibrio anguillarum serovar O2]
MTSQNKPNGYCEIALLLDYSERIYQEYMRSGKKFIYAKILRNVNERIYENLINYSCHLQPQVRNCAVELMLHLDVWRAIWDSEFETQKPKLRDVFTFSNEVNFPRKYVDSLLSELACLSDL